MGAWTKRIPSCSIKNGFWRCGMILWKEVLFSFPYMYIDSHKEAIPSFTGVIPSASLFKNDSYHACFWDQIAISSWASETNATNNGQGRRLLPINFFALEVDLKTLGYGHQEGLVLSCLQLCLLSFLLGVISYMEPLFASPWLTPDLQLAYGSENLRAVYLFWLIKYHHGVKA